LLNQKVNINEKDDYGATALLRATMKNRKDIVEILINNKANLDLQDNSDETALICAAQLGEKDIIKILLICWLNVFRIYF